MAKVIPEKPAVDKLDKIQEPLLQISKYQDWFDAIVKDDVQQVKAIYEKAVPIEQNLLLNSEFDYEDDDVLHLYGKKRLKRTRLPFHLAVAYASKQVSALFLSYGADPLGVDSDGYNILHSCVITSFYMFRIENEVTEMVSWLTDTIGDDKIERLLFQENNCGFRPLEFAAQQGTVKLMVALFECKGHCTSEYIVGLAKYRLHDVTEYEIGNRHDRSPINMMAFLDEHSIIENPDSFQSLDNPVIMSWIDSKLKANLIPLMIWFFIRITVILFFMILDVDVTVLREALGNNSDTTICKDLGRIHLGRTGLYTFNALMISAYSIIFIVDIIEFICHFRKKYTYKSYNLNGKKSFLSSSLFYRINQLLVTLASLMCGILITYMFVAGLPNRTPVVGILGTLGRLLIPICSLFSISQFLQMLPYIGKTIISLQKMFSDMARFMLIFTANVVLFAHVFGTFVHSYSTQGCVEEFSSPFLTFYTLFRMMLNMYDTTQLQVQFEGVFMIMHAVFVFVIGVQLINFLIAVMSDTASRVAETERVIWKLQQLAVIVTLEDRIMWFSRWLYKRLCRYGFYCKNDSIFVKTATNRRKYLLGGKDMPVPTYD